MYVFLIDSSFLHPGVDIFPVLAGVVDGRNIWANDIAESVGILESLQDVVGKNLWFSVGVWFRW